MLYNPAMAEQVFIGPEEVIRRLLRLEHGVRKCARIMLFMTRKQLMPILFIGTKIFWVLISTFQHPDLKVIKTLIFKLFS